MIDAGLDESQAGAFYELLPSALSFSCKKSERGLELLWTCEGSPDASALIESLQALGVEILGDIDVEPLDETRNWLAESYHALPPITIGPFFIYGSHYDGEIPSGKHGLLIDAATAFGSGEHGTTSACLLAIEHVRESGFQPRNILDMGCGSGILAAAAARLWPDIDTVAADNDPECVIVTERHLTANRIDNVATMISEGYAPSSEVWAGAPYDFVIANILAAPLIEMAPEQSRAVADHGYLILSGTLQAQAEKVLNAYTPHGFTLAREFPNGEWMTLLLRKTAET